MNQAITDPMEHLSTPIGFRWPIGVVVLFIFHIHTSIYLFIYLSMYLYTYLSIYSSIYQIS